MSERALFYFKIDGQDPFVFLPSLIAGNVSISIWHLWRVPPGIHSDWYSIASAWLDSQRLERADLVATIEDGYFFSYAPPPSRRVFNRVRAHRRLALGETNSVADFDDHLKMVLTGHATNVKEYYFDVPGATPVMTSRTGVVETVEWEILPVGWWRDPTSQGIYSGDVTSGLSEFQISRLEFFDSLTPNKWLSGRALGGRTYWIAVFDTIAFAECPLEGNAIYWCSADECGSVLQMTKLGAIAAGAGRIVHKTYWKSHVVSLLNGP